jgi:hypothetical protein
LFISVKWKINDTQTGKRELISRTSWSQRFNDNDAETEKAFEEVQTWREEEESSERHHGFLAIMS